MFSSSALQWDNANLRVLPVDKKMATGESRQVPNCIFSLVELQPVKNPVLICKSDAALSLLGISGRDGTDNEVAEHLGGNRLIPGSQPAAHCYCGHQFGSFAGQLGDGAAMYLGEVINPQDGRRWELQLKGAGKTPYSRSSDGRKVVRSSIREFLCSEAMHFLGIATTRAGSVVTSDSTVARDPYYDGNVINEKCTIVSRIAPNFFRFGSLEIFKRKEAEGDRAGPSAGNTDLQKELVDHIITSYFPSIAPPSGAAVATEHYRKFYREVVRSTATLCAQWQGVGFVHGVLNTDNMSIMGLTIDYGPFAFLEAYDADFTPNGSDGSGRYTFERQPAMCKWNLGKLAEALVPLLPAAESSVILDETYDAAYEERCRQIMTAKLGLAEFDAELVDGLFASMAAANCDFTDTMRALTAFQQAMLPGSGADPALCKATLLNLVVSRCASPEELAGAMKRKLRIHRLNMQPAQIEGLWAMLQEEPAKVEEMFGGQADIAAIREEIAGEKKKLDRLIFASSEIKRLETVSKESKSARDRKTWEAWVDRYAAHIGATAAPAEKEARVAAMNAHNPTFILRNWVAQEAIEAADKGDYSGVAVVLSMLETPFEPAFCSMTRAFQAALGQACSVDGGRALSKAEKAFLQPPPNWAASVLCTCSS